jgi:MoaA/NifB/PqqE/SkfB family radical SAM enzyme
LAGFEVIDIAPDGEIRTCFYYPSLGNIKEKGLPEIIKSQKADLQRRAIKKCNQPCMLNCYLPLNLNVLLNDVVFLPIKRFLKK